MQHVQREHTDYEAVVLAASTAETRSMPIYVRQSALNVYGWMDWILKNNLPLSFCDNRAARSAMDSLTRPVEGAIATELPDRFGLLLLATLMGVPLVGCANHRLNLAVQADMDDFKADLDSVHCLMLTLCTLSQSAKLRKLLEMLKTALRPVIRQDTGWASTFGMVKRYFELLEHLNMNGDALLEYLPPPAANRRQCGLLKELKKIESVAKALQAEDVTLFDVRVWFDGPLTIKPKYERFI
ncbi:hypothetical protein PHMEG_00032673, partial [Phytophthora megakarya]